MRLTITRVKALAAAGVFAVALGLPAVAHAQTDVATASGPSTTQPPEVENTTIVPTTLPATTVTTAPEVLDTTVSQGGLAVTGSDITGLTLLGIGAIGVGSALLAGRKRRHA